MQAAGAWRDVGLIRQESHDPLMLASHFGAMSRNAQMRWWWERVSAEIARFSSAVSEKSKMLKFSRMRSAWLLFGIGIDPCSTCQRRMTCAGVRPFRIATFAITGSSNAIRRPIGQWATKAVPRSAAGRQNCVLVEVGMVFARICHEYRCFALIPGLCEQRDREVRTPMWRVKPRRFTSFNGCTVLATLRVRLGE